MITQQQAEKLLELADRLSNESFFLAKEGCTNNDWREANKNLRDYVQDLVEGNN